MPSLFLTKLEHGAALTDDDRRVVESFGRPAQTIDARQDIIREGDDPRVLPLVLEGWACRYKQLEDGRRVIVGLFLPGDLCEPYGVLPRFMDHPLGSLTAVTLANVNPAALRAAAHRSPSLEQALWWDLLSQSAIDHERVVSLGRRNAIERLAHLFCELGLRLSLVGLGDETGFPLPLTQTELGDLLGLSNVHVNRSLQELRGRGLIALRGGRVTFHNLAALRRLALFDPNYLHLNDAGETVR